MPNPKPSAVRSPLQPPTARQIARALITTSRRHRAGLMGRPTFNAHAIALVRQAEERSIFSDVLALIVEEGR